MAAGSPSSPASCGASRSEADAPRHESGANVVPRPLALRIHALARRVTVDELGEHERHGTGDTARARRELHWANPHCIVATMIGSAPPGHVEIASRDGDSVQTRWVDDRGIIGVCWRAFDVVDGRLQRVDGSESMQAMSGGQMLQRELAVVDAPGLLERATTEVRLFGPFDEPMTLPATWPTDAFVAIEEGERARLVRRQRVAFCCGDAVTFAMFDEPSPEVLVNDDSVRPMQPVAMFVLRDRCRLFVGYAAWLSGEHERSTTTGTAAETEVTGDRDATTTAPMNVADAARHHLEATPFRPSDRPIMSPSPSPEDAWPRPRDDHDETTMTAAPGDGGQALPWRAREPGRPESRPPSAGAATPAPMPEGWRPLPNFPPVASPHAPTPDPQPEPPPNDPKPASAPPRRRRSVVIDTIWKGDDAEVMAKACQWASIRFERPKGLVPRLGREALVQPPRRDWFSDGRAWTLDEIERDVVRSLDGDEGASDALAVSAVVAVGRLAVDVSLSDELEALRAALVHLAVRHKPIQRALEATKGIVPGPLTPQAVLRAGIEELVRGADEVGHGGPALRTTAKRTLVRARRHRQLEVLGGPHLVTRWTQRGGAEPWAAYLPVAAAASLPLEVELAARAVVTVHPRCDPDEPGPWALKIHALARVLPAEALASDGGEVVSR